MAKFRIIYMTKKVTEVEAEHMDDALIEAVTIDTTDSTLWIEDEDDYIVEEIEE